MENKVRNWSIVGLLCTIVTGVSVNLLTEWLKPALPGGGEAIRPAREDRCEEQRRKPADVVKPDRSGHKALERTSISAPEGDDR